MAAIATGTNNLSPFEQETLHLRLATAASLGDDPNDFTEGIISDILSGRNEPVPQYNPDWTTNDHAIRTQILNDDKRVWDAVFAAIENGQIDVLDHFIALGFDISRRSPQANQYPVFVAVKASQSNIMRHLINLKADVNGWSSMTPGIVDFGRDNAIVRTPLMIAAEQGNLNICKILCETAFADPMLIAPDGQTAQRLAARNGHKEVVQYLPAHRGGSWRRLKYDYNHRWTFIRHMSKGIYYFCRIAFFEIPKWILYTLPKEILKAMGKGIVKMAKKIPPVTQWPGILKRALIALAKSLKAFGIALGKGVKATPKALYKAGKYIGKQTWKGIKAVPGLVKTGAKKTWNGIKAIPGIIKSVAKETWSALKTIFDWLVDLLLSIASFLHTVLSAITDFFRSITLADIINGAKVVLRAVFVQLPQILWSVVKALGRGAEATLIWLFGNLYWIAYWICYALQWVVLYVPKKLAWIVVSVAGGIRKAFTELWVWISPKSMV